MTTDEHQALMTRSLLDIFNEHDRRRRTVAIGEVYSPDSVFYEEDAIVTGPEELNERVQQLLDGAPGFVFTPDGRPIINHDLGRAQWTFGPPDGPPVVFGTDIARIADNRIQALYVFVEPPSS
jgi:hypothetical protein